MLQWEESTFAQVVLWKCTTSSPVHPRNGLTSRVLDSLMPVCFSSCQDATSLYHDYHGHQHHHHHHHDPDSVMTSMTMGTIITLSWRPSPVRTTFFLLLSFFSFSYLGAFHFFFFLSPLPIGQPTEAVRMMDFDCCLQK